MLNGIEIIKAGMSYGEKKKLRSRVRSHSL